MRLLCLLAFLLLPAAAEVIDRLAITIDSQIITQLQIDEELRVTAMLNHESAVARDLEHRRDAADRLVEQLLIKSEMQLSRYALPDTGEVDKYYQQIEEVNGGPAEFGRTLLMFHLTPDVLRSHLELQLTELKFIDVRFRPDANVSDADIEAAYQAKTATWKQTHTGTPPSLDASRESLRAMLVEDRTDTALNTWLAESRKRVRLIYLDKTLQ
jgi:hypothetical protein